MSQKPVRSGRNFAQIRAFETSIELEGLSFDVIRYLAISTVNFFLLKLNRIKINVRNASSLSQIGAEKFPLQCGQVFRVPYTSKQF